jgi:hypothetical protein
MAAAAQGVARVVSVWLMVQVVVCPRGWYCQALCRGQQRHMVLAVGHGEWGWSGMHAAVAVAVQVLPAISGGDAGRLKAGRASTHCPEGLPAGQRRLQSSMSLVLVLSRYFKRPSALATMGA